MSRSPRLLIALLALTASALAFSAPEAKHKRPAKPAAKKTSVKASKTSKPTVKTLQPGAKVNTPSYAQRSEAMQMADAIATRRNLDPVWVRNAIGQARLMPGIVKASAPPPAGFAKNWTVYRSRFIDPIRIKAGVQFWSANQETLKRAEEQMGVPPEIIVGIVGVESIYGQQTGNFRVIDALCTLSFDFPSSHPKAAARAAFFQAELEEYLALTARTKTDPTALRGSYAGALGMPQFMPSSWAKYAIDFDDDGRVDLFLSQADVIGSVANYFKAFNWQRGMPTHYAVKLGPQTDMKTLLEPDILPSFSAADFASKGAELDAAGQQHTGPLALVELQNGDGAPQYVAGTQNFYAITRYNWSSYYAMAVIELGQAISAAMPK